MPMAKLSRAEMNNRGFTNPEQAETMAKEAIRLQVELDEEFHGATLHPDSACQCLTCLAIKRVNEYKGLARAWGWVFDEDVAPAPAPDAKG